MVEKVQIRHADGRTEEIASAGVFAYVGLEPNSEFLPAAIQRDTSWTISQAKLLRKLVSRVEVASTAFSATSTNW